MFGIDSGELLIIAVVALVVIGPKDLPRVMRAIGNFVGKARGMARHFRSRRRHDDPRVRTRGHGKEVEGGQRADHARASDAAGSAPDGAEDWPAGDGIMGEPWPEPDDAPPRPAPRAAPRANDNRPKPPPRRSRPAAAGGSAPPIPKPRPPPRMRGHERRRSQGGRGGRARQEQGAVARPSDRAQEASALECSGARRGLRALPLAGAADLRLPRPAPGQRHGDHAGRTAAHLYRNFRGLLRRDQGRLLRRFDGLLPDHRQPDLAVRRPGPLREGEEGVRALPDHDALPVPGGRGAGLLFLHAGRAAFPARLFRQYRRGPGGGAARHRQLSRPS